MHSTFAGPHIEPYYLQTVGSLGEVKEKSRSSAANREFVHKGNLYGLKVGWNFKENIAAGLDFGLSSSKWTLDSPASIKTAAQLAGTSLTDEFNGRHYGVFAATRLKDGLVSNVGFYYTELTDNNNNSVTPKNDKLTGLTTAVGVGYVIAKIFKIGFEWRGTEYDGYKDDSTGRTYTLPDGIVGSGKFYAKEFYLSFSIPLSIGKK